MRVQRVMVDTCSNAQVNLVVTNGTGESFVVVKVRTTRDDVPGTLYELSGDAVVAPFGVWRFRVFVGRDPGPIVTEVELVGANGAIHHVRAHGRVRGVHTHYVN